MAIATEDLGELLSGRHPLWSQIVLHNISIVTVTPIENNHHSVAFHARIGHTTYQGRLITVQSKTALADIMQANDITVVGLFGQIDSPEDVQSFAIFGRITTPENTDLRVLMLDDVTDGLTRH